MGWTTQRTYTTAETITASQLNVMIRDDLRWLYGEKPSFRARHDQNQFYTPIGGGPQAFLYSDFATVEQDSDGMAGQTAVVAAPASAGFTVRTAGKYVVTACAAHGPDSTGGYRKVQLRTGDGTVIASKTPGNLANTQTDILNVKSLWNFAVGDQCVVYVGGSAGEPSVYGSPALIPTYPRLTASWLGN